MAHFTIYSPISPALLQKLMGMSLTVAIVIQSLKCHQIQPMSLQPNQQEQFFGGFAGVRFFCQDFIVQIGQMTDGPRKRIGYKYDYDVSNVERSHLFHLLNPSEADDDVCYVFLVLTMENRSNELPAQPHKIGTVLHFSSSRQKDAILSDTARGLL